MMTTSHPYTVPIIAGDLRRAEFVKQTADVFDHLDAVSQDMFNRIAIRLNVYRAQLNKFNERIEHANGQIDRIKGSKRAIQVHSSARYPVDKCRSTYQSIFEVDPNDEETKPPVLHHNLFRLNETIDKFIDPTEKTSKTNDETLIVFKQYEDNFIQKTKKNALQGLGKPPNNIRSVLSFLTYNTQENPYTKATKVDPLSVGGRKRQHVDEPAQSSISETPAPGFYSQKSDRPLGSDIAYNPTLGLVPQLSLPDNLPDLGNFATFDNDTTIEWTKHQMTSIAPSMAMSMLPDIGEISTTTATFEPVRTSAPQPPPAPPADLPAIIPLTSTSSSVPPAPPPPPAAIPPPPMPPVLSPSSASEESAENPTTTNAADDGDDGNPLLAQIRNFGKTKKLRTTQANSGAAEDAPLSNPNEQESIMDSLKKRLLQRRGFITGEVSNSSEKVTAAAPTPPPPSTGGAFTDAIAAKAKEIAEEQQRRKDDSDDDDEDEDWE